VNGTISGPSLLSRALVDVHVSGDFTLEKLKQKTPEAAQSMVIREIFRHDSVWDDLGFAGFPCSNCDEAAKSRDDLGQCANEHTVVRLQDLITVNASKFDRIGQGLIKVIGEGVDSIGAYRDNELRFITLCSIRQNTHIWDPRQRNLAFVKAQDLPKPLFPHQGA
jgi:hypothetical protein